MTIECLVRVGHFRFDGKRLAQIFASNQGCQIFIGTAYQNGKKY
jgi:hypothetical protein